VLTVTELLQELIRFDTTNPPGNETACIEFVRAQLEEAGCETTIYAKDPARPNLVSRLSGGSAPPLLLQGHVDVVTTAGQDWTHPPFEARLEDGHVWGRGALDMKAGVAMLVNAFVRAKRENVQLPGDLVLVVLSDEEAGGNLGARYVVEEQPQLFEGMRYALGEFGGFTLHLGGKRFYPIQVAEKQICWLKATVRGPGGHGAMVNRGGTVARLGKLLSDLDRKRLPVHVTPVLREFVDRIAAEVPRKEATVLRSLLKPRLTDVALRLLGERGTSLEPMLRNTVNATIVRGGEKINVVPSEIEVELDGRALPGVSPEQLIAELHALVGQDIELELVRHDPGPAEPDLGLFDTLAGVTPELDPDGIPIPLLQIGVTDGRFFSRAGVQTYGFLPMRLPEGFQFAKLIHAADERIPVDALEFGAEAVWRAVQRFH
jgi:acetylornithine deacetylase/succinyl-diaminopimelate desuccinylase-like protein